MIFRLLAAILVIIAVSYAWNRFRRQPAGQRKKLAITLSFYLLAGAVLALVATGRVHWITAVFAAVVPFIVRLVPLAIRLLPFLSHLHTQRTRNHHANDRMHQEHTHGRAGGNSPSGDGTLSVEEALAILGLEAGASDADIVAAHKKLIQRLHPDRGGSNYLAAKLNQAKTLLLKQRATNFRAP